MTEDLNIKMISPEEEFWSRYKEQAEKLIISSQAEIEIQQAAIKIAEVKLKNIKENK